jgi:putative ATPase
VKELREVVKAAQELLKINGLKTILFVDEIHRWNKAQQDALLPHIESGLLTLIGATTENPYYSLVSPLLSRCQMFELFPIVKEHILEQIDRALQDSDRGLGSYRVDITPEAKNHFAEYAGGDIRNALNALEMAVMTTDPDSTGKRSIDLDTARESIQKRMVRYARSGDEHYHYASAFIKSMRGSDPDAALYWMCAMLDGGEDPEFIFRRMLIFASEDVGMADSNALNTINSAHDAFHKCGMPEGMYFLSHACIYLSIAPKSNSTGSVFSVMDNIRQRGTGTVPPHLRDKTASRLEATYLKRHNTSEDYRYPHEHPGHWVEQQYLPDTLSDTHWYKPGTEGFERKYADRLEKIKKSDRD